MADSASEIAGAIGWAEGQIGSTTWDGYCLEFVQLAYQDGGNVDIGSADTAVDYWNSHASLQHPGDLNPPDGALVFWGPNPYTSDGHVALSIGGGTVISTAERDYTGVHEFTIAARNGDGYASSYLGWMMPPGVLASGGGTTDKEDIIATEPNGTNSVKYMIGYNDGSGLGYDWGGTNLVLNTAPTHMVVGDLNGDGKTDILATEPADQTTCPGGVTYMVGLSNGDGTFNWERTNLVCDTAPTQLAIGDVQGNGRMDIIATEPACPGGVRYMIGYNDGSGLNYNWSSTNLTCNTSPTQLALADVNGDGKADIIATEPSCPGGVQYMVGMSNGNGTFNWDFTNLTCNTAPTQMAVGNVLGNGRQDIIATEPNGTNSVKYMIGYNDGSGLNYDWGGTNLVLNTAPTHMVLGDVNGDGKADIVATEPASCPGGVTYLVGLSNGDGTFNWQPTNLVCNTAPDQIGVGAAQG
jgi:hypothetical protein